MKKMFFIAFGVLTLTAVGCREQDEAFDAQDEQSLKLLKKSREINKENETNYNSFGKKEVDGDPTPPPIK